MKINGTLTPAYGRDYSSAKALESDWLAGKDFILNSINGTGYINREQVPAGIRLQARYSNLRRVTFVSGGAPE